MTASDRAGRLFRTTVAAAGAGLRVDVYLADEVGLANRSQLRGRLQKLQVNGAAAKLSRRLQQGDLVEAELAPPPPSRATAEPIPLVVIYEDDDVLVVDKPSGMAVHPGSGRHSGTLVNALLHHVGSLGERFDEPLRPGIVHRLDMDTSGVMIVAKHPRAHADLADQFRRRTVRKTYLAWVLGRPVPPIGRIDTHLARDPRHPLRFRVSSGAAPRARRAVTRYRLRATLSERSLLLLRPLTGRTHQLRVHCSWRGLPIAGDPLYGSPQSRSAAPRLMLHARHLRIRLPGQAEPTLFSSPPPEPFPTWRAAAEVT